MKTAPTQFNFITPYSIKVNRKWILYIRHVSYSVMFEDSVIITCSQYEQADIITAALNGAYNLGRSQVLIEHNLLP